MHTPAELADVEILFTMMNDADALQGLLFEGGLLEAMGEAGAGKSVRPLNVSCATLPVDYVQHLVQQHTQHGVDYAAMPVIGRPDAAAAAKLHLLFAGSPDVRARLEPIVVPTVGQALRDYGAEPHKANVMKISFNMMLVQRYGLTAQQFTSLLSETLFDCTAYRGYGDIISRRAFLPAGASLTGVGLKDTTLALKAGEQACVPLPYASVARDHLLDAMANGMGDWDWAAVAVVSEQHAGLTPTPAPNSEQKH